MHILDLATGEQIPTLGPDKTLPPEDMYGTVVQAALSPDGAQLATLYRDDSKPDHTAFVHLLDLAQGSTVCIDLHEPFGTGEAGSDALCVERGRHGGGRPPGDDGAGVGRRRVRPRRDLGRTAPAALPRGAPS